MESSRERSEERVNGLKAVPMRHSRRAHEFGEAVEKRKSRGLIRERAKGIPRARGWARGFLCSGEDLNLHRIAPTST